MVFTKASTICFIFGFLLQGIVMSQAKPADCGCAPPIYGGGNGYGCGGNGYGCGGNGYGCGGYGCGYPAPAPITPPISFAPVPQAVPVRVPVPRPQSVTIPNIILALLPPTPKVPVVKPCLPPPIPRPQPIVLPIPRPYPVPVPDYGCEPSPCGC